jgi:hypothetical protein
MRNIKTIDLRSVVKIAAAYFMTPGARTNFLNLKHMLAINLRGAGNFAIYT